MSELWFQRETGFGQVIMKIKQAEILVPSQFACLMVFNATFNNISIISWLLVLLVEETREPGENHRPVTSHWQTLTHELHHVITIV
jgi:hypothetical protein